MESETESRSEVARLLQQIELEYQAAYNALHGLSAGGSRHEFITAKMERVGECHQQLAQMLGEQHATQLVNETLMNL